MIVNRVTCFLSLLGLLALLPACEALDTQPSAPKVKHPVVRTVAHPIPDRVMVPLDLNVRVQLPEDTKAFELAIPYHPSELRGMDIESMRLVRFDPDRKQFIDPREVNIDTTHHFIRATITRGGTYSILALPANVYAAEMIRTVCGLPHEQRVIDINQELIDPICTAILCDGRMQSAIWPDTPAGGALPGGGGLPGPGGIPGGYGNICDRCLGLGNTGRLPEDCIIVEPQPVACCGTPASPGMKPICFTSPRDDIRIFPGRPTPTADRRDTLPVTAKVCPPRAGVTVYFRSQDIDDPSSDAAPVDTNGAMGDDNRGTPNRGTLAGEDATGVATAVTNALGFANIDFTVTLQPGDNFQIEAARARADLGTTRDAQSGIITVWRQLHVERDDMGNVTGNQVSGNMTSSTLVSFFPLRTRVGVTTNLDDGSGGTGGRFEGGRFNSAWGTDAVISNTANSVLVDGLVLALPFANSFTLRDDDQISGNVPMADTSAMASAYNQAYIQPVFDTGNDSPNVAFDLNTDWPAEQIAQINLGKGQPVSTADYWTVTLHNGFQMERAGEDNDPDDEGTYRGVAHDCAQGTFLAAESIRDWIATSAADGGAGGVDPCPTCTNSRHQDILTHEVGHLLSLSHGHGAVTAADPNGGVMRPSCCGAGSRTSSFFTQTSLDRLRDMVAPDNGGCP